MKPQIVESGSVVIGPTFRPKDARCGEKRFTWSVCTSLPGRRVPHSTFSSVKSNFKCGFLHFLALTFHTELISLSGSFSICSSICLLSSILLLLINPLIPCLITSPLTTSNYMQMIMFPSSQNLISLHMLNTLGTSRGLCVEWLATSPGFSERGRSLTRASDLEASVLGSAEGFSSGKVARGHLSR